MWIEISKVMELANFQATQQNGHGTMPSNLKWAKIAIYQIYWA